MRGRTLNDSFIILDEAQNTSPEQMQMFLTRLGFGSKVVVTGDVTQVDLPRDQASGLIQVQQILDGIDGIAFVRFDHRDVVRHKLVQRIVEAYREHAEETGTERTAASARVHRADRRGRKPERGGGRRGRAPSSSRARCCAPRGSTTASSGSRSSAPTRCARSSASTSGSTRRPTSSPSRSTGATSCPRAFRARSATSSSARRSSARPGEWPLTHGLLHLLGYDHGEEMERRERELD